MAKQTALYQQHVAAGGKMVDFAGWEMPLHYGSQVNEHHRVRQDVGMFDVSHMQVVDILGPGARDFLRHILANDVDRLQSRGKALYSCMLNDRGGIIDDLITYFIDVHHYRLILNAGTADTDLTWLNDHANGYAIGLHRRDDLSMIAIQGPHARHKVADAFAPQMLDAAHTIQPFECVDNEHWFIARTGYTGEDGYEVVVPTDSVADFWQSLQAAGIHPCGLGARDTLRLEAGLNLYGADMNDITTPLESNLAWTVAWEPHDRIFIGRGALAAQQRDGISQRLVGLVLEDKGILRSHQKVLVEGIGEGEITSGGYGPTVARSIALARVPAHTGSHCQVDIRGKLLSARVVKPPFVRKGQVRI